MGEIHLPGMAHGSRQGGEDLPAQRPGAARDSQTHHIGRDCTMAKHFRGGRAWRTMVTASLALTALFTPPAVFAATTWVVDSDGKATATDCDAASPAFTRIQDAVHNAAPGDTIFICPGTYDEQVAVAADRLTLQGSGVGSTILQPSAVVVNSTGVLIPFPVAAIVLFDGVT